MAQQRPLTAVSEHVATARAALMLQRQGKPLWEIAEDLGLPESTTRAALKRAMAEAADLIDDASKRELLAMEVDRLNQLQSAQWGNAMNGDTRAADTVLKIIDKRTKLLGLIDEDDTSATMQTVVVTGDSTAYIDALRAITTPKVINAAKESDDG